jgi:serine/threonine-protein kinase ULK/ATG1
MPKLIDNYVLNRKIGAGQYGEVFRGYDRATNNEIAVKSIQRDKVKGRCKIMQANSENCWKVK